MLELSLGNLLAWAVQVAAIGAAAILLPVALRLTQPRPRLLFLRAVLAACLVLPLLQPWLPAPVRTPVVAGMTPGEAQPGLAGSDDNADGQYATGVTAARRRGRIGNWPVERAVAVTYAGGVGIRLLWLVTGLVMVTRLRRSSEPLGLRPASIDEAALLAGADAEFRLSSKLTRPVTFGLRQPVVLVPAEFLSFGETQQTAVAAHELLHVARRDWIRAIGDEVLLSFFWFHPAFWWLIGQIHLSVEQVVDATVVRLVGARKPYLEALLKLAAAGPTPALQPASAFLKHGHLAQRVALLVREVSMSRLRLVSSFALVLAALAGSGWYVVQAFPLTATPDAVTAPAAAPVIAPVVAPPVVQQAPPPLPPPLAPSGSQAKPAPPVPPLDVAAWEYAVQDLTTRAAADPANPMLPYTLAVRYWERAYRDGKLGADQKRELIAKGLQAADRAITLKSDYADAFIYKGLLVRLQAGEEKDLAARQSLLAQAEALRVEAARLKNAQNPWSAVPPNAVRVGGSIAAPTKIKDAKPQYPADAMRAGAEGVVIVEAVIGEDGKVRDARVIRSVPLLDDEAVLRVKQWEFTPTVLNGKPVPVVMTATVNFVLRDKPGAAPVPPPPPAPGVRADDGWAKSQSPNAVRVGGEIRPPARVKDAKPVYPGDAKEAGVQGVVIIEAVVGIDGKVQAARILRSITLLDQAALDAVNQWEFAPTLLNGAPVPVILTVTVNFTLQ